MYVLDTVNTWAHLPDNVTIFYSVIDTFYVKLK